MSECRRNVLVKVYEGTFDDNDPKWINLGNVYGVTEYFGHGNAEIEFANGRYIWIAETVEEFTERINAGRWDPDPTEEELIAAMVRDRP